MLLYDVAVIGAGPGGSAAAYYLARQGLNVALIDKAHFPRDKTCGDALTPGALDILGDMGLLDTLLKIGYCTERVHIVSPHGRLLKSPLTGDGQSSNYLLIVPRLQLDDLIRQAAVDVGAAFEPSLNVTNIVQEASGVQISGERGGQSSALHARFVIVATGANATLLVRMGILKRAPHMMLAARAYYENIATPEGEIQMHFDGVPLPGYGWVFPTSAQTANIGVGLCSVGMAAWWVRGKAIPAFRHFVSSPILHDLLKGAEQVGSLKGYPLRVDFLSAPTYGERALLIGEAAGLANPLTGEGIGYALESGRLAAEHLARMFTAGDFSQGQLATYDSLLRGHFGKLFRFCNWTRDLLVNPLLMESVVRLAERYPALERRLVRILLN